MTVKLKNAKVYEYQKQFKVLFWIALLVSYIFAVLPHDIAPSIPEVSDKAHHVFAFVVLALLLRLGYHINYWYALLSLVAYGVLIEFSQIYAVNRFAEYKDVIADTIGTFIGLSLYKYIRKVI
ncbi:MAG: Teicoplanin resistance protein VanZ [uncultured Sulfurovum sp.]|uniref:Teicoplanin resistance protein VanZ n=1 Tax=uncultured Sulfurovum sp. TaxID=269237 RepID=A0A6S6U8Q3_9BACT|nr:MAG: Teicoplanin resistance protein VanZ [uncultured Sulfurovum sp.]